jgi:hypothetical protein
MPRKLISNDKHPTKRPTNIESLFHLLAATPWKNESLDIALRRCISFTPPPPPSRHVRRITLCLATYPGFQFTEITIWDYQLRHRISLHLAGARRKKYPSVPRNDMALFSNSIFVDSSDTMQQESPTSPTSKKHSLEMSPTDSALQFW